jgi:hypothetical protein
VSDQVGLDGQLGLDLLLTTRYSLRQIPSAEVTIADAFVIRQAVMAAFMQAALYAKEVAVVALQLAKLDAVS